jgi:hypothetical protein
MAERMRALKATANEPIPVYPKPGQCSPCGMRGFEASGSRLGETAAAGRHKTGFGGNDTFG